MAVVSVSRLAVRNDKGEPHSKMQLPHLNQTSSKQTLGKQSLRAITQPLVVRRGQGRSTGLDLATDFLFDQTLPVPDSSASWKTLEVARKNLLNLPYTQLAQVALDLSPEVNKGLHDFLRFVNPSHVLRNSNPDAERASHAFVRQLDTYYGSFSSHIDSLWSGIFLTGGAFPELILGQGGRSPLDLVFNDPSSARFRRERDPMRGPRWRLGQETRNGYNYLDDTPLVKYLGFDRLTDNPYGRPIVGPRGSFVGVPARTDSRPAPCDCSGRIVSDRLLTGSGGDT